ncbi:hypothetical protein [Streptomyces sp. RPT161]|uniref:hypothetical protein n=1 Tax=Streptomyces sp. RPT161 TaxID=3015993 RepID=UPI0022B8C4BC|nr:hypothetical protein [Streptomyces sp. RPT161]
MNRNAWRLALTVVSVAAIATTGWSLYAVARHYQAPEVIAGAAVAVFDGIAYACLHLASEASAAGRSAFGARLTALFMASVSVYLNITHSNLIGGGIPAAVFFAVPTIGLLAVSEMSWAGPRAAKRAELGEQPYRLPAFGGWAWLLAPHRAGKAVKSRAVAHIEGAGQPSPKEASADRYSASERLREHFASMDPAEAIRIAHDAQPDMPPAELASLLIGYGVVVNAVQVALVLGTRPPEVTVERGDAGDAHHDAPQVGGGAPELPEITKSAAIRSAEAALGPDAPAVDIALWVRDRHGLDVEPNYVRTVLSRDAKKPAADKPKMEGGYA